jgi:RNA polymerase sigma-70 factor, ECF subfamily
MNDLDQGQSPLRRQSFSYGELARVSDEALMLHLSGGHHDALAVLFDRYHRLVLNIALRILRDSSEAEDLMQSVFLEIFRSAAQFDATKGTTKIWILQYAYHRSFNRRQYLKLRGMYERSEESAQAQMLPATSSTQSLGVLESARLVQQALSRLSKTQKEIMELAFYEGLTMREIADRTNESFDSVRHHYYRGLEKLRSILCREPEGKAGAISSEGMAHVKP